VSRSFVWGVAAVTLLSLVACGVNPFSPPTAADILAKPAASNMKDAHVVVEGTGGGAVFKGDGVMVFKPKFTVDLHLTTSIGAIPVVIETISVDGTTYTKLGSQKFTTATAGSTSDPTAKATDLKIAGEETIGSDKAWHITGDRGGQPFEEWVRESDGYLLKMVSHNDQGASFTFTLDKFNIGTKVTAPPASEIKPPAKNVTGSVGQPMALNGLNLTVVSADTNAKADNPYRTPASGKKFVVAEVLYENVGSDPIDPGQWTLTDSQSFNYQMTFSVKDPSLDYQQIPPGARSRGYIAFEVPANATGLTLKAKIGDDSASVPLQ
jgi:hypothetical protein